MNEKSREGAYPDTNKIDAEYLQVGLHVNVIEDY